MKLHHIIFKAALATFAALPLFNIQAQINAFSDMKQAVIGAYTEMIQTAPADYMSYFSRGNEYYNQGDYIKALDDINNALRYAPADETDIRYQCYVTRANIYVQLRRYNEAVTDLNSALSIDPECYSCLYQLANVEYELGHYNSAREAYLKVQRVFPRNREVLFGLARIAVKENNLGMAAKYCDEAIELAPNASDSYIQRAIVRSMMSNHEGAVDDYLTAISQDDSSTPRALRALVTLSDTNYPAVINGLSRAIATQPKSGAYYYLRAVIAQAHGNYLTAIDDLNTIIDNNLDGYAGLNYSLAECNYALGRYDTALSNIDYAIGGTSQNADYYSMKAKIRNAMGAYDNAVDAADKALSKDSDCTSAIVQKALAMVGLKRYNEASVLLAEAIMNEADNAYLYMLRAWVSGTLQSESKVAKTLYERVLDMDGDFDNVKSLRGFAQLFTGDEVGAERWMREVLDAKLDSDGQLNYYAACFFAQQGNTRRALDHMEASLRNGYANYHDWCDNNDARINVAPLRNLPEFKALMTRFASIFGR